MVEEWVKDARNEARLVDNLRVETSKALGIAKQKNKKLGTKLVVEERGRKSAEAGLKSAQDQAKEQCKKLHYIEIELDTAKQEVVDLKAKLEKAKAARVVKVAADISKKKFYDLGVQETEAHLIEELDEVYRDYCWEVWNKVLNLTRVPTALEWRRAENVYYPLDLQEAPVALLGLEADVAPTTTAPEQPPSTQAFLPPFETSKGPDKAGGQG